MSEMAEPDPKARFVLKKLLLSIVEQPLTPSVELPAAERPTISLSDWAGYVALVTTSTKDGNRTVLLLVMIATDERGL